MITWWCAEIVSLNYRGSPEDIIAADIGVKVEKIGRSMVVSDNILISSVIKLPHILEILEPMKKAKRRINECNANLEENTFRIAFNQLAREVQSKIDRFTTTNNKILETFVYRKQTEARVGEEDRVKRQILPFLIGAGTALAMEGLTEYQIYKINRHISENKDAIGEIKNKLLYLQNEVTTLDNKVVGFATEITTKMEEYLKIQQCMILFSNLRNDILFRYKETVEITDNVLWTALTGNNNLLLTPKMIGLETLVKIIKNNSALNQTIFFEHPSLLYSLANIHLIELSSTLDVAHFILDIPIANKGKALEIFRAAQVGMGVIKQENLCVYYDLPTILYMDNGILFEFSTQDCKRHNDLQVCPIENFSNQTACVQKGNITCKFKRQICRNYYQYDMSQIGIMIRNSKLRDTYVIKRDGFTELVEMSEAGTIYLPWNSIKGVQIGNTLIESPNSEHIPLYPSSLSFNFSSMDFYLDETNVTDTLSGICKKYNKSLESILPPIVDYWDNASKDRSSTVMWAIISCIILTLLIGFVWGYKKFSLLEYQMKERNFKHWALEGRETARDSRCDLGETSSIRRSSI